MEADRGTSIDKIVDHLDDGSADVRTLKVQLHHVHLPKMQDCGLLEYDPRSGDIVIHIDDEVESLLTI